MECQLATSDKPEVEQTCSFRGSKSRNKVSVDESAEGSLTLCKYRRRQERLSRVDPVSVGISTCINLTVFLNFARF
jgi:hypothetical protein